MVAGVLLGLGAGLGAARFAASGPQSAAAASERVAEILAGDDLLLRQAQLATLLATLGPDDVDAVRAGFDAAPLDRGDPELQLLATWWASIDPQAAYGWTTADWRANDANVRAALFRSWAHTDPQRAWGTAQTIPFRGHREVSSDAAIVGWDESGQPELIAFLYALPEVVRQRAAEIVARRRVVRLGSEAALEWANGLESEAFRNLMVPRVASAAALAAPEDAARWAEPKIAAAKRPTGLPRRIATRWVQSDPDAAFAWLATLPDGHDRDDGVTEAFRDWLRRDPDAARAWVEALEPARWNEPAIGLFARTVLSVPDPERALAIVGSFTDPPLRDYLTTVIARAWLERDREAADSWIRQADIPDGVRERAYMVSRPREKRGAAQAEETEPPDEDAAVEPEA